MLIKPIDSDKKACIFTNWYEDFGKISIRSVALKIPDDVLEYLRNELLILPKECNQSLKLDCDVNHFNSYDDKFDESEDDEDNQPEFVDFSAKLSDAIQSLGGSAFLKTDWHSPKDALWITPGQTLKIKDISDVYHLLKASSLCKEDLTARTYDNEYHIILKKWIDIHPGTEFRCFVKNKSLIAISPKNWPCYHEHIVKERSDIVTDIVSIFKEKIKNKFDASNYVFDVIRSKKDRVILVDFCPFGPEFCESLAFDWEQLNNEPEIIDGLEDEPEFRYLPEDCGIQPTKRNNYGVPQDIINMFRSGSSGQGQSSGDSIINRLVEVSKKYFFNKFS